MDILGAVALSREFEQSPVLRPGRVQQYLGREGGGEYLLVDEPMCARHNLFVGVWKIGPMGARLIARKLPGDLIQNRDIYIMCMPLCMVVSS